MSDRPNQDGLRRRRATSGPTSYAAPGDAFETALDVSLQRWPDAQKSERDWAHFAARINARVALTKRAKSLDSISDEELLASPLSEGGKESHKCAPLGEENGHADDTNREAQARHSSGISSDVAPVSAHDGAPPTAAQSTDVEGSMGQSTYDRDRDRRGFKELAKLAGSPPRPRASSISGVRPAIDQDDHDSGLVDLQALASVDAGAVDRASVTPLASSRSLGDAPRDAIRERSDASGRLSAPPLPLPSGRLTPPPMPPSVRPLPSTVGPLVSPTIVRPIMSAQAALGTSATRVPAGRSSLGRITAVVGFAALAAGAFFVVRTMRAPAASAPDSVAVATHAVGAAAPVAQQAAAQAPALTPAANPGVDPLSLPKEVAVVGGHHATRTWHPGHGPGGQALVAKGDGKEKNEADDAPVAEAAPAAKETPATPPPASNNALLDSIKQASAPAAVPTPEGTPVPAAAAATPGSGVAQRPSQGQVTGALGAVLPDARGCLNEDDPVSRAHVVFASDGTVQSVSISGFAAGKPVEACIKAALSKAHVAPFAEATYGATVTVRP
jgi:hypothetical protein